MFYFNSKMTHEHLIKKISAEAGALQRLAKPKFSEFHPVYSLIIGSVYLKIN